MPPKPRGLGQRPNNRLKKRDHSYRMTPFGLLFRRPPTIPCKASTSAELNSVSLEDGKICFKFYLFTANTLAFTHVDKLAIFGEAIN